MRIAGPTIKATGTEPFTEPGRQCRQMVALAVHRYSEAQSRLDLKGQIGRQCCAENEAAGMIDEKLFQGFCFRK